MGGPAPRASASGSSPHRRPRIDLAFPEQSPAGLRSQEERRPEGAGVISPPSRGPGPGTRAGPYRLQVQSPLPVPQWLQRQELDLQKQLPLGAAAFSAAVGAGGGGGGL